ncbi:MAG: hypothetical protein U0Q47_13565 [Mycobacterium sp.]
MDCSDDPQAVGGTINGMDPKVIGNPIVAWRDDTTLQIGWGAHALVVERAAPGLPAWIAMLNGGRSVESALAAAGRCRVTEEQARRVLKGLATAGLLAPRARRVHVALAPCGLLEDPFRQALRQAGVEVAAGADVLVFPQGQVPSLVGAPLNVRRLVPVWFTARAVHVGPVLDEACGPCPRCVDLTWLDADPDWTRIAAQATGVPLWQEPSQLTLAAGAIAHIADAPQTVGLEMIFDPDRPGPSWRVWEAHAGCGCQIPVVTSPPAMSRT